MSNVLQKISAYVVTFIITLTAFISIMGNTMVAGATTVAVVGTSKDGANDCSTGLNKRYSTVEILNITNFLPIIPDACAGKPLTITQGYAAAMRAVGAIQSAVIYLAFALLTFYGVQYMLGGLEEDNFKSAKKNIKNAVISILIVLLAPLIMDVALGALGFDTTRTLFGN